MFYSEWNDGKCHGQTCNLADSTNDNSHSVALEEITALQYEKDKKLKGYYDEPCKNRIDKYEVLSKYKKELGII